MKNIAIVGGGIAGLTCALELDSEQYNITIFDKGRRKGGRVSSRSINDFHFDHGAQYISDPESTLFMLKLEEWKKAGIIQKWDATLGQLQASKFTNSFKGTTVYVGIPEMSSIASHMSEKLENVRFQQPVKITSIFKKFNEWYLNDDNEEIHGGFDMIVIAIPPDQAKILLRDFEYLVEILEEVQVSPRWACMLGLKHKVAVEYDAVFIQKVPDMPIFNSPIRWIARNSSKPCRLGKEAWVIHASKTWSKRHLEKSEEWVTEKLVEEFKNITGFDNLEIEYKKAHRWRYAIVDKPLNQNFVLDNNRNIALAGDYCIGNNIEAAYTSGKTLGQRINNLRV